MLFIYKRISMFNYNQPEKYILRLENEDSLDGEGSM